MERLLKLLGILTALVLLFALGVLLWLSVTEYRPNDVETLTVDAKAESSKAKLGKNYKILTFNTGYAGLGRDSDFFMDGGKMVRAVNKERVEENLNGIAATVNLSDADIVFLQEVDLDSARSYYVNQLEYYRKQFVQNSTYACNFRCGYVPFPFPTLGKIESGIVSMTNLEVRDAIRVSLPVPFKWPVRVAQIKRCLLMQRIPIEGSQHELVLVNLHLEAYDDGEGKIAQTRKLMDILKMEYESGNYVIAGGDFNQMFEGAKEFPILQGSNDWQPGHLALSDLPEGLSLIFDSQQPTCRSLLKPYDGNRETTRLYLIDGFIVSDNVKVDYVQTIDHDFRYSDHNPVVLQFSLQ